MQLSTTVSRSVACSDLFTALTLGGPMESRARRSLSLGPREGAASQHAPVGPTSSPFTSMLVLPACSGRKMQEYLPEASSGSTLKADARR